MMMDKYTTGQPYGYRDAGMSKRHETHSIVALFTTRGYT
jgi:hypothetical protein